jgi:hypothetical protein
VPQGALNIVSSPDVSPNLPAKHADSTETEPLSVALIGPDAERRSAVARSLAETRRARVREFDSYPPELDHLQRLLASFDVIVLDLDSQPEFALEFVEKASVSDAAAIMVYSEDADPKLAVRSMRAGARECFLLPLEQGIVADALARATAVLRQKPLPAEKSLGRLIVKPERWKIPDDKDAARALWFGDTGPAEAPVSGTASLTSGRPGPQEKLRDSDLRGPGNDMAQVSAVKNELPGTASHASADARMAPAITWPAPGPMTYGNKLTAAQLNARASVAGAFAYTPGAGYVLPVGTHTLWVTFTPADPGREGPLLASTAIVVAKATPALSWPTPAEIARGAALGEAQLNASTPVPGSYDYSPALGEVLPPGTHTLSVTFTPADGANYTAAQATVLLTVAQAMPDIDWRVPAEISCGTALDDAQLNAWASVPGRYDYSPATGEVLPPGTHTLSVTFTPADGANYATAHATVPLTVSRAKSAIEWPAPAAMIYGTQLSAAQLNAAASVPGTLKYTPGLGAMLAAGEHTLSVVFTPADTLGYYPSTTAVPLTVAKATPEIAWSVADPITHGAALGITQLNATATVPGSFAYTPAAGEILGPGAHEVSVTFTPADTLNYSTAHAVQPLTVREKSPSVITWPAPAPIPYGTALDDAQLNATASVPGSFVFAPSAGHILAPGKYTLSASFAPSDTEKYTAAQASVVLQVEALPDVAAPQSAAAHASTGISSARADSVPAEGNGERMAATAKPRETRTYKGAVYEKGEDGQWHILKN